MFSTLRNASRALCPLALTLGANLAYADSSIVGRPYVEPTDKSVVAHIGKEAITYGGMRQRLRSDLASQQSEYESKLHRLQEARDRKRHDLIDRDLEKLLDDRALALEAAARGATTGAVLANVKVPVVTDEDARAMYESRKALTDQPFEQLEPQIKQYLASRRSDQASREFLDQLRAKYAIASTFVPYRVAVNAAGPTRGPLDAPITIVEFGDFQCPFCAQAEAAVRQVAQDNAQDVRVVFRHYPLKDVHPNAQGAAVAAVCADQQGKFWEMHDALYADQKALAGDPLKETAKRVGLDVDKFTSCLKDGQAMHVIYADVKAGDAAGVSSTPTFYVNGRPIVGSVPVETFQIMVRDELSRVRGNGKGG